MVYAMGKMVKCRTYMLWTLFSGIAMEIQLEILEKV